MMDSPGREPEMLTGLAAAGCNLILFTTGRWGRLKAFPLFLSLRLPAMKTLGSVSKNTLTAMLENHAGEESYADATQRVFDEIMLFINGDLTKAEQCRYNNSMNIYVTGPTI